MCVVRWSTWLCRHMCAVRWSIVTSYVIDMSIVRWSKVTSYEDVTICIYSHGYQQKMFGTLKKRYNLRLIFGESKRAYQCDSYIEFTVFCFCRKQLPLSQSNQLARYSWTLRSHLPWLARRTTCPACVAQSFKKEALQIFVSSDEIFDSQRDWTNMKTMHAVVNKLECFLYNFGMFSRSGKYMVY